MDEEEKVIDKFFNATENQNWIGLYTRREII